MATLLLNLVVNYADSDITRSVVDPDFLPPGENAKWACLNLLRIALTILNIRRTMSMNEYQRVVCFALSPTSIAVAGFVSMVCKWQSRFTNTPRVRIRLTVLNAFSMQYQHNTWVK